MKFICLYFFLILTLSSRDVYGTLSNIMTTILSVNQTPTDNIYPPWALRQMIQFINCGSLPVLNNSHIQFMMKWKRKQIYLEQKCNRFFEPRHKNANSIICSRGKWILDDKKCELITCPHFSKPAHSYMINISYTYNSVVYFSCLPAYELKGNRSIRCGESKQWSSPPPVCEIAKCLPQHHPRYGEVNSTDVVKAYDTVKFNCSQPYSLNGEAILTCLQDGSWDFPAPICTEQCLVPDIKGTVLSVTEYEILKPYTLIKQGVEVLYSCSPSFIPVAFGVVQCISGRWYPDIRCKRTCKIEKIDGLNFILTHNFTVIEYSCPAGETLIGESTRTCLENGTWSGKLPSCKMHCQLLPAFTVNHYRNTNNLQFLPFGSLVAENTLISYSCQNGLVNETTCLNGILDPQPHCIKELSLSMNGFLTYGTNHQYVCSDSYSCESFGYHSNSCEYKYCDRYYNCAFLEISTTFEITAKDTHQRSCCALKCF
ncbi:complement factor H-like [Argonauta hians]